MTCESQSLARYAAEECVLDTAQFSAGSEVAFFALHLELTGRDVNGEGTTPLSLPYAEVPHFRVIKGERLLRIAVPRAALLAWAERNGFRSQLLESQQQQQQQQQQTTCFAFVKLSAEDMRHFLSVAAPQIAAQRRRVQYSQAEDSAVRGGDSSAHTNDDGVMGSRAGRGGKGNAGRDGNRIDSTITTTAQTNGDRQHTSFNGNKNNNNNNNNEVSLFRSMSRMSMTNPMHLGRSSLLSPYNEVPDSPRSGSSINNNNSCGVGRRAHTGKKHQNNRDNKGRMNGAAESSDDDEEDDDNAPSHITAAIELEQMQLQREETAAEARAAASEKDAHENGNSNDILPSTSAADAVSPGEERRLHNKDERLGGCNEQHREMNAREEQQDEEEGEEEGDNDNDDDGADSNSSARSGQPRPTAAAAAPPAAAAPAVFMSELVETQLAALEDDVLGGGVGSGGIHTNDGNTGASHLLRRQRAPSPPAADINASKKRGRPKREQKKSAKNKADDDMFSFLDHHPALAAANSAKNTRKRTTNETSAVAAAATEVLEDSPTLSFVPSLALHGRGRPNAAADTAATSAQPNTTRGEGNNNIKNINSNNNNNKNDRRGGGGVRYIAGEESVVASHKNMDKHDGGISREDNNARGAAVVEGEAVKNKAEGDAAITGTTTTTTAAAAKESSAKVWVESGSDTSENINNSNKEICDRQNSSPRQEQERSKAAGASAAITLPFSDAPTTSEKPKTGTEKDTNATENRNNGADYDDDDAGSTCVGDLLLLLPHSKKNNETKKEVPAAASVKKDTPKAESNYSFGDFLTRPGEKKENEKRQDDNGADETKQDRKTSTKEKTEAEKRLQLQSAFHSLLNEIAPSRGGGGRGRGRRGRPPKKEQKDSSKAEKEANSSNRARRPRALIGAKKTTAVAGTAAAAAAATPLDGESTKPPIIANGKESALPEEANATALKKSIRPESGAVPAAAAAAENTSSGEADHEEQAARTPLRTKQNEMTTTVKTATRKAHQDGDITSALGRTVAKKIASANKTHDTADASRSKQQRRQEKEEEREMAVVVEGEEEETINTEATAAAAAAAAAAALSTRKPPSASSQLYRSLVETMRSTYSVASPLPHHHHHYHRQHRIRDDKNIEQKRHHSNTDEDGIDGADDDDLLSEILSSATFPLLFASPDGSKQNHNTVNAHHGSLGAGARDSLGKKRPRERATVEETDDTPPEAAAAGVARGASATRGRYVSPPPAGITAAAAAEKGEEGEGAAAPTAAHLSRTLFPSSADYETFKGGAEITTAADTPSHSSKASRLRRVRLYLNRISGAMTVMRESEEELRGLLYAMVADGQL